MYYCLFDVVLIPSVCLSKLYLTGAVYSLDGSDSLKDTMQTSVNYPQQVCQLPWAQNLNPKDKTRPLEICCFWLGSLEAVAAHCSCSRGSTDHRFYPISHVASTIHRPCLPAALH